MINKRVTYMLILFCISFFIHSQNKQVLDGVFAIVGNNVIFHSDIDNQILQYQSQGNIDDLDVLRKRVSEELFFQKMLLHFAEIDSVEVDYSQVQNTINQRISFFKEQLGSIEKVENYFQKNINELTEELTPIVKDQLVLQKMQFEITKDVLVSPNELNKFVAMNHPDSLPIIDAQYQVAHILKIPDAADFAVEETLSKIESLRNRIINGEDFATMAILYSEDPGSSRNGGAYYNISKGDFVKEFESVAFSLNIDEVSDVFKTEYGYHVAKLIDRKGNKIDIRHILMTPKISTQDMKGAKLFLDSLKNNINQGSISFVDAAKQFSSDLDSRYNGGLLVNLATNTSFFSLNDLSTTILNQIDSLEEGSITDPIYIKLPNGKEAYRIIKLVSKIDQHVANLTDDYPFLNNYYLSIKKEKKIKEWQKNNINNVFIQASDILLSYDFYKKLLQK